MEMLSDWEKRQIEEDTQKRKNYSVAKKDGRGGGRRWCREMMREGEKGVKERKWSERKWRGQVQWQSRWKEGKREGEKEWWQGGNRESGEVNVSTVVWWGVSVPMPGRFSTYSFKDPMFFLLLSFSFQASPFLSLCLNFLLFLLQIQFTSLTWLYITKKATVYQNLNFEQQIKQLKYINTLHGRQHLCNSYLLGWKAWLFDFSYLT